MQEKKEMLDNTTWDVSSSAPTNDEKWGQCKKLENRVYKDFWRSKQKDNRYTIDWLLA